MGCSPSCSPSGVLCVENLWTMYSELCGVLSTLMQGALQWGCELVGCSPVAMSLWGAMFVYSGCLSLSCTVGSELGCSPNDHVYEVSL